MRIAILNITGGGMSGGYKEYLQNIIPRIAKHPDLEAVLCVSPKSINVKDWFVELPNVEFRDCHSFRFLSNNVNSTLNHYLEKFSPDVIFIPIERFFRFNDVPVVNMVQNMEPIAVFNFNKGPLEDRIKTWVRRFEGKKSLKKSNRIIVPSEYARNFLVENWKISKEKIGLVYHGVGTPEKNCFPPKTIPKEWKEQFLFTAGSIRPTRGLEDIIYALEYLSDNNLSVFNLAIAGEVSSDPYKKELQKRIQKQGLSRNICWVGTLNKNELSWCFKNCQAFIMSSRVESFGIIAMEAMAHGSLCISSDSSCLPEIFDKAAIFYPSKEPKILAKRISEILNWAEEKKQKMRQLALTRASQFSWDRCVEQTVTELAKVIKNRIE